MNLTTTQPIPAEFIAKAGEILRNAGSEGASIDVLNTGSHAIQVRGRTHFFEVNRALKFDRAATFGMRLDRPSIRFEPGEIIRVNLVRIADPGSIRRFGQLIEGPIDSNGVKQRGL